jgi:hypothetical protein
MRRPRIEPPRTGKGRRPAGQSAKHRLPQLLADWGIDWSHCVWAEEKAALCAALGCTLATLEDYLRLLRQNPPPVEAVREWEG